MKYKGICALCNRFCRWTKQTLEKWRSIETPVDRHLIFVMLSTLSASIILSIALRESYLLPSRMPITVSVYFVLVFLVWKCDLYRSSQILFLVSTIIILETIGNYLNSTGRFDLAKFLSITTVPGICYIVHRQNQQKV